MVRMGEGDWKVGIVNFRFCKVQVSQDKIGSFWASRPRMKRYKEGKGGDP